MNPPPPNREVQALLDVAIDAVIIIDHRGIIESFNPAAERMFGYSAGEILGSNVGVLMPEPDRSAHDSYIARYLGSGIPHILGIGREVAPHHIQRDARQGQASRPATRFSPA